MSKCVFLLFLVVVVVSSEFIDFKNCENASGTGLLEGNCTVSQVQVNPCTNKKKCVLRKGSDVYISFDFIPQWSAEKLKTDVFWTTQPWTDLDSDACKGTTCPTVAGTQQQFNSSMHLGKKLPNGIFEFKWQLYDAADEAKKCCFKMTVKLRK